MKEQTHRERKAEEPEKKKRGGRGGGREEREAGSERERGGWGWGGVTKGKTERGPKNDAERAKISVPTRTPQSFSKD